MLKKVKRPKIGHSDRLGKTLKSLIYNEKPVEAKELIKDLDCNVNWIESNDYCARSCLIWASGKNQIDIVRLMLQRPDLLINFQTPGGESALIEASAEGNLCCVELLVDDPRINVNLVNDVGQSALWLAYRYNEIPVMKLLISHGADVGGGHLFCFEVRKED